MRMTVVFMHFVQFCSGDNPQHITFSNTDMRKHGVALLDVMEPFNGEMLKMVKETQLLESSAHVGA